MPLLKKKIHGTTKLLINTNHLMSRATNKFLLLFLLTYVNFWETWYSIALT